MADDHLSQMATQWTLLFCARGGPDGEVRSARRQLLEQYGPAVRRYLLAAVRDPEAADELYQEFALRLVDGRFDRAHPERGRFRDFLKTCLYHLVVDRQRRRRKLHLPLPAEGPAAADGRLERAGSDHEFLAAWRAELLVVAWEGLRQFEGRTGQPLYTVLRLKVLHPELHSPELAEQLAGQISPPPTAVWFRKRLHFARAKFTEFLLQAVRTTLDDPTKEELYRELLDLNLLEYCRAAVERCDPPLK